MKIFAISIARSARRHAYIRNHLAARTRNDWELVGVDGSELRGKGGDWLHNAALTSAQVGCALSHVLACTRLVESGLHAALIVEDDVILPTDIDEILSTVSRVIRSDEVISLYNRTMKLEYFSRHHAAAIGRRQLVVPLEARVMRTTAAYVIGHEAARRMSLLNSPVEYTADDWDAFHRNGVVGTFRLLHPIPVRLYPFESTLSHDRDGISLRALKRVVGLLPFHGRLRALRRQSIERRREGNVALTDEPSPLSGEFGARSCE